MIEIEFAASEKADTAKFTIPGQPVGKGRPQFSKRGKFVSARTPDKTVLYENLVKTEYERQCGDVRFSDSDMLRVVIMAYYTIPTSTSKKKRAAMLARTIRPIKKPDLDNIVKVVADSLNQLAYRDDAQIVEVFMGKFYAEVPRVEVLIERVEVQH